MWAMAQRAERGWYACVSHLEYQRPGSLQDTQLWEKAGLPETKLSERLGKNEAGTKPSAFHINAVCDVIRCPLCE